MDGAQKRQFGIAFGAVNSLLDRAKKQHNVTDEGVDDEVMLVVLQFCAM